MSHIKLIFALQFLFLYSSCNREQKELTFDNQIIRDTIRNVTILKIDPDVLKNESDSLKFYYEKMNFREIWYVPENRKDLINEIKFCYQEGLNPNDYAIEFIENLESKRATLTDEELVKYDILLTQNFEKLALHLHKGKLNPKEIYKDWDLKPKNIILSKLLKEAISNQKVASTFKELKPQHQLYKLLKKSLLVLNEFPSIPFTKIEISKEKLQLKDSVQELISIKKRLHYWKDYTKKDSVYSMVFDTITHVAVKKFQTRHGLLADGIIGKGTIQALNTSKNERQEQIIANLERWRWFPADLGSDYLIVNLPDFYLHHVVNQDTISKHKVIIGTEKRRTPILMSKISNFVFNPTWTIPPTIIKEDLKPSASKNRNYFSSRNLTIYNNKGQETSARNWNPERASSYRYVQKPGSNNSLGLVKFNFPNNHLVYLHDTNHRDYFEKSFRSLSSGCVRVENPLALAKEILVKDNEKKWAKSEIDSILKRKITQTVFIKNKINVYLFYWTSWIEGDELQFRTDIYGLDKELFEKLRN